MRVPADLHPTVRSRCFLLCILAAAQVSVWGLPPSRAPLDGDQQSTNEGSGRSSAGMPEECLQVAMIHHNISYSRWRSALPFVPISLMRLLYSSGSPLLQEVQNYVQTLASKMQSKNMRIGTVKIRMTGHNYSTSTRLGLVTFTVQLLNIHTLQTKKQAGLSWAESLEYDFVPASQVLRAIMDTPTSLVRLSLRILSIWSLPVFDTMARYSQQRADRAAVPLDDEDYFVCDRESSQQQEGGSGLRGVTRTQSTIATTAKNSPVPTDLLETLMPPTSATTAETLPVLTKSLQTATQPTTASATTMQDSDQSTIAHRKSSLAFGNLELTAVIVAVTVCIVLIVLIGLWIHKKNQLQDVNKKPSAVA